jgi:hypothetical protein
VDQAGLGPGFSRLLKNSGSGFARESYFFREKPLFQQLLDASLAISPAAMPPLSPKKYSVRRGTLCRFF